MNSLLMMVNIAFLFNVHTLQRLMKQIAGKWKQDIDIPTEVSLELSEKFLKGRNKEMFLAFMRGMLQWRPEDRKTAKDLLQDPWLNDQIE